jgi:hypothetical protein
MIRRPKVKGLPSETQRHLGRVHLRDPLSSETPARPAEPKLRHDDRPLASPLIRATAGDLSIFG